MFVPKHFEIADRWEIAGIIEKYSFGILVSDTEGELMATHIPFLLRRDDSGAPQTLAGHMARANPHWRAFDGNREAMVIFQGPHAYISPSWYPAKEKVPTWNYVAVHAYGTPTIIESPDAVRALLAEMVSTFESGFATPWPLNGQPEAYLDRMQQGVVAFDIPIRRLDAKAKLNQNHTAENRAGAIEGLRERRTEDDLAIAAMMEEALGKADV